MLVSANDNIIVYGFILVILLVNISIVGYINILMNQDFLLKRKKYKNHKS